MIKNLDFTSTPVLAVCGLVALITVIAYWRVFKKMGLSGFNAIVPVWSEVRMANETTGFGVSFIIAVLYIVSSCLVAFAYVRSMTQPSTENRMLLLASLGVGGILMVMEGISHYKLGQKFGKSFLYRFMLFIPCISTIMIWVLSFTRSTYTECAETFGMSKQEIYALSGIYGQSEYNPSPVDYQPATYVEEFVDESNFVGYDNVEPSKTIEPIDPIEPIEPIEPMEPIQPAKPSKPAKPVEITLEDISEGRVGYDDLTLENRPLYPFETKKPERIEADRTEMQKVLEEVLFDEDNEELQEAVLQFIQDWKQPKPTQPKKEEPVIKAVEVEKEDNEAEDIDYLLERAKKKTNPKKVNFDDDFWK